MSMQVVPTRQDAHWYSLTLDLDGATYTLELRWNERAGAWSLTVRDVAETVLAAGLRLVVDVPLLARHTDARLPRGQFLCVDTQGEGGTPGLTDLGTRFLLLYVPRADMALVG